MVTDINELVRRELEADVTNGAALLDDVETFIGRFVSYPSEAARIAHVLWIAHTWLMHLWDSTPRIAFLSPEPGSGKTRALEVSEPLVPRAVHAVNTTPAYLFRKVSDVNGPPTILYDEADTVFGAKENEDVRGMLNAGHRRGATAGRCVVRGKIIETEELPAYCAVALAGLNDLPDTIMSRSVLVRMQRRAPNEPIEPWRLRTIGGEAAELAGRLELWAAGINEIEAWPDMPAGVEDRNADVWEALLSVAEMAGGEWPKRARVAAVALVAAAADRTASLGVQLLADLKLVFTGSERLPSHEVIEKLLALPESAWVEVKGKPLDARGLSTRLRKYEIKPKDVRIGAKVLRGYDRSDLYDAWSRYLPTDNPPFSEEAATPTTSPTTVRQQVENVAVVADVADKPKDSDHQAASGSTAHAQNVIPYNGSIESQDPIVGTVLGKVGDRTYLRCKTCGKDRFADRPCPYCAVRVALVKEQ